MYQQTYPQLLWKKQNSLTSCGFPKKCGDVKQGKSAILQYKTIDTSPFVSQKEINNTQYPILLIIQIRAKVKSTSKFNDFNG
jgi:hypothetical protein